MAGRIPYLCAEQLEEIMGMMMTGLIGYYGRGVPLDDATCKRDKSGGGSRIRGQSAVHPVGVRNFGILKLRVCTRPVSVMAKPALPDTEKKSGRVQSSKDHAKRHADVSTIKMYKLRVTMLQFCTLNMV